MSAESDIEKEKLIANAYFRKYMRIKRHGNEDTTLKRGRKCVSISHKKRVRQQWEQKKKQEKIDTGQIKPRGRPRKENPVN